MLLRQTGAAETMPAVPSPISLRRRYTISRRRRYAISLRRRYARQRPTTVGRTDLPYAPRRYALDVALICRLRRTFCSTDLPYVPQIRTAG
eukprot:2570566-Rhodomonas_salina.1